MKNGDLLIFLILVIALLVLFYFMEKRTKGATKVRWAQPLVHETRTPEYRPPPMKTWKPQRFQQMGLLTNDEGDILPLYGRETWGHRDRYHYYTTTPGQQIYSLPISHKDRDCLDDVGCQEFYGKEGDIKVEGLGDSPWTATIYRNNNHLY